MKLPIKIRLRKSKTDQEAIGKVISLTPRAQNALLGWIEIAKISDGFLFRGIKNNAEITSEIKSGQLNRIYKRLAKEAGLNKTQVTNISEHFIRVGAAQDLLTSGASLPMLMHRGRWSKPKTAMRYAEASASEVCIPQNYKTLQTGCDIDLDNRLNK